MTLAQAGLFAAPLAVGGGVAAATCVGLVLRRRRKIGAEASIWLGGLALLACLTLLPTIDTTLLSQDASVHRAAGVRLATAGTLALPDPTLEPLDEQERLVLFAGGSLTDKRFSLVRVPGGVVIPDFGETVAYPSFSHLLSVWVGIAYALLGPGAVGSLGLLFAFTAWWAVGLIAWRDGGGWAAVAAVALLATWLPEHWFGRFLMPEILAQALVWSGVAAARFAMDAYGLDPTGWARVCGPSAPDRAAARTAGALAGLCLGVATFARLEQFWVFVPALLLVRVFSRPARFVLPPGALLPFLFVAAQGVFHLWWIPTDYGNRIYKTASGLGLQVVVFLARIFQNDGYALGFFLGRVVPVLLLVGVGLLLWWGRRLDRRSPGSLFRPLLAVVAAIWLVQLYSRGFPEDFAVAQALGWYVPWPVWGAVLLSLPSLGVLPGLEWALLLEAVDQVVFGRVSPEHVWASRRLVTVALPVLALAAARGAFPDGWGHLGRAWVARGLVLGAVLLGAIGLRPVIGAPLQDGGHGFAAEVAADLPPSSTVVLVKPLDWLHLASALWLGEGRHALVMREEGYPRYDEVLADYLRLRVEEGPLFVLAGAVVGPRGGDDAARSELARLPGDLRLDFESTYEWRAPFLEVTSTRAPKNVIERRSILHLYRVRAAAD